MLHVQDSLWQGRKLLGTAVFFLLMFAGLGVQPVLAHNALDASNPAGGAVLAESPSDWSLTFSKDVPLDSASAEIVNANGVRTALPTARYGASSKEILFALPLDLSGAITGRWRLVGVDGHVITARVKFSVGVVPVATTAAVNPTTGTQVVAPDVQPIAVSEMDNSERVAPEPVRFAVRSFGYLALLLVGGMMITELFVAAGAMGLPRARASVLAGAVTLVLVPFLQLMIFLDDSRGFGVVGSVFHVLESFDTTAGSMMLLRFLAGGVIAFGAFNAARKGSMSLSARPMLVAMVMYLISLGYVGHSRSMAWPVLGVAADVVHTGAAMAWLGGLAVFVFFVVPLGRAKESFESFRRFGDVARYSVIAIVVTGIIQTLRLHGSIITLFTQNHGRWLLLKLGLVVLMLKIGDINRRRLLRGLPADETAFENRVALLRRASFTEIANGALVMLVTAKLVTSSFN
jgi:copper transport protein